MAWRPIKTAPKNGTRILVYFKKYVAGDRVTIMHYAWAERIFVLSGTSGMRYGIQPSHWMPLPEPPGEK